MAFDLVTVADALSNVSMSGIVVKDLDAVKAAIDSRQCPVFQLYPQEGFALGEVIPDSFGSTAAKKHLTYTFTYGLFYEPISTGRDLNDIFPGMVAAASTVITAITNNDALTGSIDIRVSGGGLAGTLLDAADNAYHGVKIVMTVLEYIN